MEERRLSELKSDFINNMTHELKTPLSTITVAGRTLEKEQVLSDHRRYWRLPALSGNRAYTSTSLSIPSLRSASLNARSSNSTGQV
jgi:signal transduction histidine kinase